MPILVILIKNLCIKYQKIENKVGDKGKPKKKRRKEQGKKIVDLYNEMSEF
ncbi:MAG: hypothetical protein CM15mL6_020 [uncultured marine virus]|nr:MAG: hypothetical protein CM15mL6_020 [uncultured marine virus]